MRSLRTGKTVIVAAILAGLAQAGPVACGSRDAQLADRGQAPDFRLPRYDGGKVSLSGLLQKGPVVVDFWATWCAPCKRALPRYQELQDRYAQNGLTVVAISQDDPQGQSAIGPWVHSQRLTLPVLLDGRKSVAAQFKVGDLPTTFLIAPDGRIAATHVGYKDGDEARLEQEIRALLRLPPAGDAAPPRARAGAGG